MTLKELFNLERQRVRTAKAEGRKAPVALPAAGAGLPVSGADYKDECSVLPKSSFEGIDFDVLVPFDFKLFWPDGTICCLAALPFNDGGYGKEEMQTEGKWKNFLADKKFLRLLMVMPLTKLTSGFGGAGEPAGKYHEFLPDILKKDVSEGGCSFMARYEDPSDSSNEKDRAVFIAQCGKALSNLKKFLEH